MRRLLFAILMLVSPLSFADSIADDTGLQGGIGTLGLNAALTYKINDYFGLGVGINEFNHSGSNSLKGVDYDYSLKLSSQILFLNVSPFGGGFHLTGGLMNNGNDFTLTGQPTGGTYTFNGTSYSASQVGTVTAALSFKHSASYLGIGWGGNGDWGLTFDVGAMQQGKPVFTLSASRASSNKTLAADVSKQQAITQNDVDSFTWYPQIKLGFYFHF